MVEDIQLRLGTRADKYESFLDWLITVRNPLGKSGHFARGVHGDGPWEPTFFTNEWEFYILALLTFMHAWRHGARYLWLWFAILAHGLTIELVSYWVEPIDNFWHGQSTFMLFGQREPVHIVLVYPSYIYIAAIAVQRAGLSELCEACALGLLVIVLDVPYDVMGIKLLWWTWHDTDANIRDRHYWVPWTSYYFHMTFACSFSLIYNKARRYFTGVSGLFGKRDVQQMPYSRQVQLRNYKGEFKALLCAGLFSMPAGILQFVPGYHWGADVFHIHAQFTTECLAFIYGCCTLYGLLRCKPVNLKEEGEREEMRQTKRSGTGRWYYDEVYLAMLVHFTHYMFLVLFAVPEGFAVLGLHQPMGSPPGSTDGFACDQTRNLTYPYPFTEGINQLPYSEHLPDIVRSGLFENVTVWKRPYLCENGELLDEGVFDFHCPLAQAQEWKAGNEWFYICGTDWTNKNTGTTWWEYFFLIMGSSIIGINIFTLLLYYPYNLYDIVFRFGEFPKYYKSDPPSSLVVEVEGVRINGDSGRQEFSIKRYYRGKLQTAWETREELELDGAGQCYAENGGHYGLMYDTYGGSTRDRLKTFTQRQHAMDRLRLYSRNEEGSQTAGIAYTSAGLARPIHKSKAE